MIGIARIAGILKDWWFLIVAAAAVGAAAGIAIVAVRDPVYEAEAMLAVAPVARDDPTFQGLNVLHDSGDPRRDLATVATLARTPAVADEAAGAVGAGEGSRALLGRVRARPIPGSNLVSLRARAGSPDAAARIANAFGTAIGKVLDARLDAEVTAISDRLHANIAAGRIFGDALTLVNARLAQIDAARAAGDHTVRLKTAAAPPGRALGSGYARFGLVGGLIGLVLGLAAAVLRRVTGDRIRSADHVRHRLLVPVLAHLRPSRRAQSQTLALGLMLVRAARDYDAPAMGFVGVHEGDAADDVARAVTHALTIAGTDARLGDLEARAPREEGRRSGDARSQARAAGTVARLVGQGEARAELALATVPALEHGSAAVRLARAVDGVVLVARPGVTGVSKLRDALELLASSEIHVFGVVLADAPAGDAAAGPAAAVSAGPGEGAGAQPAEAAGSSRPSPT